MRIDRASPGTSSAGRWASRESGTSHRASPALAKAAGISAQKMLPHVKCSRR